MTLDAILTQLDGVRQRGFRWSARCPAHEDNSPSLSVAEGDRGILLRCFAGCGLQEICGSLGIKQQDLFFDALDTNPRRRKAAAQARAQRQREQADGDRRQGRRIDARREAEDFLYSRQGLDISQWTDQKLDDELSLVADARALLAVEEM